MSIPQTEVIGCKQCLSDEEGNLLIGQETQASEVYPRLSRCPKCQRPLGSTDIVVVGIRPTLHNSLEATDAA
jgi:hypothetical protein